ncbi:MAG: hypothetical protein ACK2UK_08105 [Candidatus Promineifilaceae bacterium]
MYNENLSRLSAPAVAFGGLLWLLPWVTNLNQSIQFILTIPALILTGLGLVGLSARSQSGAEDGRSLALTAGLLGLLLIMASAVGGLVTGVESNSAVPVIIRAFLGIGMLLFVLGLTGLSIAVSQRKALGDWSFTAPVAALTMLAYVVSIVFGTAGVVSASLVDMVGMAAIVSWLLLGFGLWTSQATADGEPNLMG